jgi:hypothetical protein
MVFTIADEVMTRLWKNRKNICDRLFGKTRHDVLKALTGGTINGNTTFTQELFDAFMMMI